MYRGKEIFSEEELDKIRKTPITLLPSTNFVSTISTYQSQKRLKCAYCDCINDKDFGICDYCGAPLKE